MAPDGAPPSGQRENEGFRRQSPLGVDVGPAVEPPLPEACSQQDAAERDILLAIDAEPGRAPLHEELARLLRCRGNNEAAIAALRKAVALEPRAPRFRVRLAELLLELSRKDAAIATLREALAEAPRNLHLLRALRRVLFRGGDLDGAIAVTRQLVELDPLSPAPHIGLGELLFRKGELVEAEAVLKRAVKLAPEDSRACALLARTLRQRGVVGQADRLLRRAIAREPQNEQLKQQLALLPTEEEKQAQRALMMRFESLGDNCELGIAQRAYGAEPLSLLRWCFVPPGALLRALGARFAGLGEPQNLVLKENRRGALDCVDTVFGLPGHAFDRADGADLDTIHARECQRLQFLKAKLIDELEGGQKIFVYKRARSTSQGLIETLFKAIRAYGPNTLLWVVVADEEHPSGHVEVLRDGLLKGYISRMADQSAVPGTTQVAEWLKICAAAERIRDSSESHTQRPIP